MWTSAENADEDSGGGGGGDGWDPAWPSAPTHPPLQPQRPDGEEVRRLRSRKQIFKKLRKIIFTSICDDLLLFSHLEEDPLYIAYADMMAKVFYLTSHKASPCVWQTQQIQLQPFVFFQSCAEDEEEEEEEGKEKTFEVLCSCTISQRVLKMVNNCARVRLSPSGKGDGKAEDPVPAGEAARSRSSWNGAADDQC